jgi:ATP-binding cassette subfamily C protein
VDIQQENAAASANTDDVLQLLLIRLRYKEAHVVELAENQPLWLNDPESVWLIYAGSLDVFIVEVQNEHIAGIRQFLFQGMALQFLFGAAAAEGRQLLAVSSTESTLLKLKRSRLTELLDEPGMGDMLASGIATWAEFLSRAISKDIPPKDFTVLKPDQTLTLQANAVARSLREVVWVHHAEGESLLMGRADLPHIDGTIAFPISTETWLISTQPSNLTVIATEALVNTAGLWDTLTAFYNTIAHIFVIYSELDAKLNLERLEQRASADESKVEIAFVKLAAPLQPNIISPLTNLDRSDALLAACQMVGEAAGIKIVAPSRNSKPSRNPLRDIARTSQFRMRQIALKAIWWKMESGPMLAYWDDTKSPVALLPTPNAGYEVYDPLTNERTPVSEAIVVRLDPLAWSFYRPFPAKKLTGWDLITYGARGIRNDLLTVLGLGLVGGVLSTLVPLATGVIFDQVIPIAARSQILQIGLILLVSAFATAVFQIARGIATVRIETRMDNAIQAALWDRLLSLPAAFFRQYTAGDLAQRIIALSQIKSAVSGPVVAAIMSGIFSLFNFILLFTYSVPLALVALAIVIVAFWVIIGIGIAQRRQQRAIAALQGKISGTLFQIVVGINKFRVASAESRAFAIWANLFSEQKALAFNTDTLRNRLTIFNAILPTLSATILFGVMSTLKTSMTMTTGQFLAFYAAFNQFLLAGLSLGSTIILLANVSTIYERARPIIQTEPEVDPQKIDPGELSGAISVSQVIFRYKPDMPPVLNDVSFEIRRGEFVALVGASGCGKSTLLRILLGFETPQSGVVMYDGQDLATLDVRSVRRQLGVVLQTSQLLSGSIYENIVGQSGLGLKDAIDAARLAGLMNDIEQLPMGLHTMVDEGGSTFSGGQRQRLMIARAIVNRPRILFFDEATSALDNNTQAIVSKSLEQLDATRIVIAHRLSTIINADRIIVLDRGRIVQMGTYQSLIKQPGLFANLARRQMV